MARYKPYDLKQDKFISVSYAEQVLPGTFEHTLNDLVEKHLDLKVFDKRYRNDDTGREAYDPRVLLKIVIYGYYKGLISSRRIEEACRRNVVFMALSADTRPHFTTIAGFITELENEIIELFCEVLLYAEELGLIGKEHFAIDGCKLASNASKRWSGTHQELADRLKKMEKAARVIVERHRQRDSEEDGGGIRAREDKKLATYQAGIAKITKFLSSARKKTGPSGKEHKSNITDPESAKMSTGHGVVQGFNGVAVVDGKHQIVVHAEAHGTGQEQQVLAPMIAGTRKNFERMGHQEDVFKTAKLTTDAGFHSAKNVADVQQSGVDAYMADPNWRRRDEAFANAGRYKERHRREHRKSRPTFGPQDFIYDEVARSCICPAGKKLYRNGKEIETRGYLNIRFRAPKSACRGCALRKQCLRNPESSEQRQVAFFVNRSARAPKRPVDVMREKFDSAVGRAIYGQRIGTVEPVFGNLQNKGMRRFTLRGKNKVSTQWKLFTMVHNIEKIAHAAAA